MAVNAELTYSHCFITDDAKIFKVANTTLVKNARPPPRQTRRASIDCGAGAHRFPLKSFLNAVSEKTQNNTKQKMLVLTEEKFRQQPTERGKPQRIQQGGMTEEARNACVLFPCLYRPHVCSSIVANYCY